MSFSGKRLDLIRNEIFVIYYDIPLYPNLNGFHNIHLLLGYSIKYVDTEIIDLGLLSENKLNEKVKAYSLEEKKKIALIAAVLKKPQ